MFLSAIPSIIGFLFYCTLSILLKTFGEKSKVKNVFLFFLFIGMIRHLGSIGMHLVLAPGLIFWNRVTAISLITMGLLILIFSETFTSYRVKNWERIVIRILYLTSILLILFGPIQKNIKNVNGLIRYDVTPFMYFVVLSSLYYSIRGLSLLMLAYSREIYKVFKRKLMLVITGFTIYIFSGTTNTIPVLGKYPIDIIGSVTGTFIITIAFFKYRFLIKRRINFIWVRKLMSFLFTSILFAVVFYFLLKPILGIKNLDIKLIPFVAIFLITYAYFDRWFYAVSSRLTRKLEEIRNKILKFSLSNPPIKEVEDCIKNFFSTELNIFKIKIFYQSLGETFFIGTDYKTKISKANPFITFIFAKKKPVYIEDFELEKEKYLMSPLEREEIDRIGCNLFVPLSFENTDIGILTLSDERRILEDFSIKIMEIGNTLSSYLMNYINFKNIKNLYFRTILILVDALEARDKYTAGHSKRVAEMSKLIAESLGIKGEELEYIEKAALLHDIGKIAIPDEILNKNGKLTEKEYELIKEHPVKSAEIIRFLPDRDKIYDIILHHHERWDGKGYPSGLKGNEIPLGSRIIAVADSFDAMLSTRPYRENLSIDESLKEIIKESGKQFDPEVVDAFLKRIDDMQKVIWKYGINIKKDIQKEEKL